MRSVDSHHSHLREPSDDRQWIIRNARSPAVNFDLRPSPDPARRVHAEDARIVSPDAGARVLRNTYALLALSMIPTVLGAWVGLASGLAGLFGGAMGGLLSFAVAMGLIFAIQARRDSAAAVPLLLGFTFFMGLMLSRLVGMVLGLHHGAGLVMTAFAGTSGIFLGMAALSTVLRRDLSGLGKFLFVGLVMLVVAGLANLFIQSGALMITLSVLAVGIFSAFVLHDLKRVRDGAETNYVIATLGVYLSLVNVFQNLLVLLGVFGGRDE
jgi:modulator of FtsH protease